MSATAPFPLMELSVRPEWVDFNGHMNDAAYAEAFSLALMAMTDHLGLDAAGRASTGHTIYTIAAMIRYLHEAAENEPLALTGRILEADDKRLRVWGEMHHATSGTLLATTEQLFLCVDQSGSSAARGAMARALRRSSQSTRRRARRLAGSRRRRRGHSAQARKDLRGF